MNIPKLFFLLFLIAFAACDFEDKVEERSFYRLSLNEIYQVNQDGATFEADITAIGSGAISEYGFVWNTDPSPTLENSFSVSASNLNNDSFSERVESNLVNEETYYVRAYLKAGEFTVYSTIKEFTAQGNRLASNYIASSLVGVWGDTIQIKSSKFVNGIDNIRILFDQDAADIILHDSEVISLIVPSLSVEKATLKIEENGISIFTFDLQFEFLKPIINNLSPSVWYEFDTITINGDNFSSDKDFNVLKIDNNEVEIIENTKTRLKFIAPLLMNDRTVDLVLNSSADSINLNNINYHPPLIVEIIPDTITSLSDTITLKGLNFGAASFYDIEVTLFPEASLSGEFLYDVIENTRSFVLYDDVIEDYENLKIQGQGELFTASFYELEGLKPNFDIEGLFEYVGQIPGESIDSPVGFKIGDSYYYGLGNGYDYNKKLWKYDASQNSWEAASDFIGEGRREMSSTVIGDDGYVAFGRRFELYDDIYRYNSLEDSWEFVTNYPNGGIYDVGLYTVGNQLFVAGGRNPNGVSDILKYDIFNNSWSVEADFPEAGSLEVFQNDRTILMLSESRIYEYNNGNWGLISELDNVYNRMNLVGDELILLRYGEMTVLDLANLSMVSYNVPSVISDGVSAGKCFIQNNSLYFLDSSLNYIWKVQLNKL